MQLYYTMLLIDVFLNEANFSWIQRELDKLKRLLSLKMITLSHYMEWLRYFENKLSFPAVSNNNTYILEIL